MFGGRRGGAGLGDRDGGAAAVVVHGGTDDRDQETQQRRRETSRKATEADPVSSRIRRTKRVTVPPVRAVGVARPRPTRPWSRLLRIMGPSRLPVHVVCSRFPGQGLGIAAIRSAM